MKKQLLFYVLILGSAACNLKVEKSQSSVSCPTDRSAMEFSGGQGTVSSPYLICDALDLQELDQKLEDPSSYAAYGDKYYKQIADIDLGAEVKSYLPLGLLDNPVSSLDLMTVLQNVPSTKPFNGTYDGAGHSISRLKFSSSVTQSYLGFFHHIGSSGTLKNLSFSSPAFAQSNAIVSGTAAAMVEGKIENVSVTNLLASISEGVVFGGVVGYLKGAALLKNASTSGQISGGLTVNYDSQANNLTFDTTVFAGVFGVAAASVAGSPVKVESVTNSSSVIAAQAVGGVGGYVVGEAQVTLVTNTGSVESKLEAGGVFYSAIDGRDLSLGGLTLSLTDLKNSGPVKVSGAVGDYSSVAGISAMMRGGVATRLINTGTITNDHQIFGAAGGIFANVKDVQLTKIGSTGNITLRGDQVDKLGSPITYGDVAGLIGTITDDGNGSLSIQDCYVQGTIKAGINQQDIGGIVADIWNLKQNVTISNCYVAATFEGGYGYDPSNSLFVSYRGSVIGQLYVDSGLATPINVQLTNIYYATDVATTMEPSGISFSSDPQATVTAAGGTYAVTLTGVTSADLRSSATFTGFNFSTVWNAPTASKFPDFKSG